MSGSSRGGRMGPWRVECRLAPEALNGGLISFEDRVRAQNSPRLASRVIFWSLAPPCHVHPGCAVSAESAPPYSLTSHHAPSAHFCPNSVIRISHDAPVSRSSRCAQQPTSLEHLSQHVVWNRDLPPCLFRLSDSTHGIGSSGPCRHRPMIPSQLESCSPQFPRHAVLADGHCFPNGSVLNAAGSSAARYNHRSRILSSRQPSVRQP